MGYEYFYQNIAEWLLLSMLIFIDSLIQLLILDNFFLIFFINAAPSGGVVYNTLIHRGYLLGIKSSSWEPTGPWEKTPTAGAMQIERKSMQYLIYFNQYLIYFN